jgi:hypothetical protein
MLTESRDSKDIYLYVYEWTHPNSNLVFYTLPMVHIGVKSYYQRVNGYFESLNCVLVEGFSYHHARSITKDIYVGLAKRYGFVTQIQSIVIPEDMAIVPIDMNESEVRFSFKALSCMNRIKLRCYRLYLFSSIWFHMPMGNCLTFIIKTPQYG